MATDNPYTPPRAAVADVDSAPRMSKQQIKRLSPHQNAKVFAVLFAVSSLIFVVPFVLFASAAMPGGNAFGGVFFLLAPLIYLVMGYIMTAIGCFIYNLMAKYTGGIEYEAETI